MLHYPAMERTDTADGRVYLTPEGLAPSVTTILHDNEDDSWLDAWRDRVGHEEADAISTKSRNVGTLLHSNLENLLLGGKLPRIDGSEDSKLATKLAQAVKLYAFSGRIGELMGVECPVHYSDLYAGTADLVCMYDKKLTVVDFKNSMRKKKAEWIEGYFTQVAAYSVAHDYMFSQKIEQTVVIIANWSDMTTDVFSSSGPELDKHKDTWAESVDNYYKRRGQ